MCVSDASSHETSRCAHFRKPYHFAEIVSRTVENRIQDTKFVNPCERIITLSVEAVSCQVCADARVLIVHVITHICLPQVLGHISDGLMIRTTMICVTLVVLFACSSSLQRMSSIDLLHDTICIVHRVRCTKLQALAECMVSSNNDGTFRV